MGTESGFSESMLRDRLNKEGVAGRKLGRVQVLDQVSLFEVQSRSSDDALKSFKGFRIEGEKVRARRRS